MRRRIRIDVWDSLHSVIKNEAARTGLSPNQIVNIVLAEAFRLTPKTEIKSKD